MDCIIIVKLSWIMEMPYLLTNCSVNANEPLSSRISLCAGCVSVLGLINEYLTSFFYLIKCNEDTVGVTCCTYWAKDRPNI